MEKKNQRKNTVRRMLTLSSRHDRFIATYIKAKHPDVYTEADEMYTFLKEVYPNKRDLRKVPEFLQLTTGVKSINAHYYKNRLSKKTEQNNHNTYNMVLEIPLLNQNALTMNQNELSTTIPEETSVPTDELSTTIPEETSVPTDELSTIIPEETSVPTDELSTIIPEETNVPTDEPQLIIPDKIYEDLLSEIRSDPDLKAIFNDFDVLEEDQVILEHGSIDEPSPLEWELHNLGY